jgi:hypothetical protein
MNYLRLTLMMSVFFVLSGCAREHTYYLAQYDTELSFEPGSEDYFSDGSLSHCLLTEPVTLNGIVCRDWLHIDSRGVLRQCVIERPFPFSGISVPAGSTVFFNPVQPGVVELIMFSEPVTINGIHIRGKMKVKTAFYENGQIKSCFLQGDQFIQGIPCSESLFHPVSFYADGRILQCTLSEDAQINGNDFLKGQTIQFDENGKVVIEMNQE